MLKRTKFKKYILSASGIGKASKQGRWSQSLNINGPIISDRSWLLGAICIFQSNFAPRALGLRGCVAQSEMNGGSGDKIIVRFGNVFEIVLIKQRIKV